MCVCVCVCVWKQKLLALDTHEVKEEDEKEEEVKERVKEQARSSDALLSSTDNCENTVQEYGVCSSTHCLCSW